MKEELTQGEAASKAQSRTHIRSPSHLWTKVFQTEQSQTTFSMVWPLAKKRKMKAPLSVNNEGPLQSGVSDLLCLEKVVREGSFVLDSTFHLFLKFFI